MGWIRYLSILLATCAWADDATDRTAIEGLVTALNNHNKPLTDLFTTDAPESEKSLLSASEEPWSEITSPRITIRAIRLITPRTALVECTNTQYGSTIVVRTASILLVMKKEGTQWRIACVRALQDSPGAMKPSPDH